VRLTATKQVLRSLDRRVRALTTEIGGLKASIVELVVSVAPHLLDQPGVGPITAAQVLIAWSHPRRCQRSSVHSASRRRTTGSIARQRTRHLL